LPSTGSESASDRSSINKGRAAFGEARPLTFEEGRTLVETCERGTGESASWMDYCRERDIFFVPTAEFAREVVKFVGRGKFRKIVEICAGKGWLSRALAWEGLSLTATDPRGGEGVETLDVPGTLRKYRPDFVIAAWAPSDIRADQTVVETDCVRRYLWINAEVNGVLVPPSVLGTPGVRARELPELARWTVSRLDYLTDFTRGKLVQHARVVLVEKTEVSRGTCVA